MYYIKYCFILTWYLCSLSLLFVVSGFVSWQHSLLEVQFVVMRVILYICLSLYFCPLSALRPPQPPKKKKRKLKFSKNEHNSSQQGSFTARLFHCALFFGFLFIFGLVISCHFIQLFDVFNFLKYFYSPFLLSERVDSNNLDFL